MFRTITDSQAIRAAQEVFTRRVAQFKRQVTAPSRS